MEELGNGNQEESPDESSSSQISWWQRHKKKIYIGAAVTVFVVVPFGSFIVAPYFYKLRKNSL